MPSIVAVYSYDPAVCQMHPRTFYRFLKEALAVVSDKGGGPPRILHTEDEMSWLMVAHAAEDHVRVWYADDEHGRDTTDYDPTKFNEGTMSQEAARILRSARLDPNFTSLLSAPNGLHAIVGLAGIRGLWDSLMDINVLREHAANIEKVFGVEDDE